MKISATYTFAKIYLCRGYLFPTFLRFHILIRKSFSRLDYCIEYCMDFPWVYKYIRTGLILDLSGTLDMISDSAEPKLIIFLEILLKKIFLFHSNNLDASSSINELTGASEHIATASAFVAYHRNNLSTFFHCPGADCWYKYGDVSLFCEIDLTQAVVSFNLLCRSFLSLCFFMNI